MTEQAKDPRVRARQLADCGCKLGEIKGAIIREALDSGATIEEAKAIAMQVVAEIKGDEHEARVWGYRAWLREQWRAGIEGRCANGYAEKLLTKAVEVHLAEDDKAYIKPGLKVAV